MNIRKFSLWLLFILLSGALLPVSAQDDSDDAGEAADTEESAPAAGASTPGAMTAPTPESEEEAAKPEAEKPAAAGAPAAGDKADADDDEKDDPKGLPGEAKKNTTGGGPNGTDDYGVYGVAPAAKVGNIHFGFGAKGYNPGQFHPNLFAVVEELKNKPDYGVIVVGHTDHIGTLQENMKLSWIRAHVVREDLHLFGINRDRVKIVPRAYLNQIFKNAAADNKRYVNRRVEFIIKPLSEIFNEAPADYTVVE